MNRTLSDTEIRRYAWRHIWLQIDPPNLSEAETHGLSLDDVEAIEGHLHKLAQTAFNHSVAKGVPPINAGYE